ncbi:MAG: hypothetical protein DRQ49_03420 [Gammaproteobacteria bacterium]|nr:MAG: hypothetical protein DRQ41_09800 [Gammaproteobacteria bacterium]RKZ41946.1 MAG: hypothetical protein DRQ49_03420 [Gammaproteobacteria bacterium]RKZ76147.1 MAG: hypothetical protein DRQ57_04845 [Gammaproteobacteria bacterium]
MVCIKLSVLMFGDIAIEKLANVYFLGIPAKPTTLPTIQIPTQAPQLGAFVPNSAIYFFKKILHRHS